MRFLLALVLGGMSGVLLYLEIAIVLQASGSEVTQTFALILLAVTWSLSTWLFDRGASTTFIVLARAGVVGMLEWLAIIPVSFLLPMAAPGELEDPTAGLVAGGIISLITGSIALVGAGVCLLLALIGLLGHLAFRRETSPRDSTPKLQS